MSAAVLENQAVVRVSAAGGDGATVESEKDILVEIGIWISGIECFIAPGSHFLSNSEPAADLKGQVGLLHAALQRCALRTNAIVSTKTGCDSESEMYYGVTVGEMRELSSYLRDALMLSEALVHSDHVSSGSWSLWCGVLGDRIARLRAAPGLMRAAHTASKDMLPGPLAVIVDREDNLPADRAELASILPRFGKILRWLSVIGKMLKNDEPLKPALVIFSSVGEQIFDLNNQIKYRLESLPDAGADILASLDAASYSAGIELKKVFSQELIGLAGIRPTPSIRARTETAYSILNDGFQQVLGGFARLLDPAADVFALFPNFKQKRDHSLVLRDELSKLAVVVRATENDPSIDRSGATNEALRKFMAGSAHHLFYKDTEVVGRFVEEILVSKDPHDLVPILHRFGAYLETLSGQVALRAVFAATESQE
ncbi:MAG: hypothetical protein WKF34_08160 [Pyrinomonadaceae bacterium]